MGLEEEVRRTTTAGESDISALRRARVLSAADPARMGQLAIVAERRTYARGEMIVRPGDEHEAVYLIVSGSARFTRGSADGREVTLDTFGPGEVFPIEVFCPVVRPRGMLEATCDRTTVYRIPRAYFRAFILAEPGAATRALEEVCRRLAEMTDRAEELALYDIRTRLARELARSAGRNGGCNVPDTHEQLAAQIGTRQDEVTKALRHLRERGLVDTTPHRPGITVLDREALEQYE